MVAILYFTKKTIIKTITPKYFCTKRQKIAIQVFRSTTKTNDFY